MPFVAAGTAAYMMSGVFEYLLHANKQGKFIFIAMAIAAVFNLALNIVFIPNYGIIAAAWIMAITEVTGFIINLIFVKKLYQARRYNAT